MVAELTPPHRSSRQQINSRGAKSKVKYSTKPSGGAELTEDPAHVEQGGQLASLLGIEVVCRNEQAVSPRGTWESAPKCH